MPRGWSKPVKNCAEHPAKKDGRWCRCAGPGWRYRLGLPDPATGVRGRPDWSISFPTAELADKHQREVRDAIAESMFTSDRGLTVKAFLLDEFVARKEAAGRKLSTTIGYRSILETYLVPYLGRHRLGQLQASHVQAMLDDLGSKPSARRKHPVSPGTLRNIRACLRAALSDAHRRGLVKQNVAKLVELPTVKRGKPVAFAAPKLARFLVQVEKDPLSALWLTDAVYGMRRGELAGLRWPDVDEAAHLVRIQQTLIQLPGQYACPYCSEGHNRLLFEPPKTLAGERIYPLVPEVEAALLTHRLRQDADRELYGADYADHGLVFALPDGNPIRPDWISAEFKRHLTAAGVIATGQRVPPMKALRSSMVTALHEAGTQLEVISAVTGHAGGQVTKDHYLNVSAERARAPFELIAASLRPTRSDQLSDQAAKTVRSRQQPKGV